jgi:hypothetical protein
LVQAGRLGLIEDDLRESGAVAEVYEEQGTEIAAAVDPSAQQDSLADVMRG